MTGSVSYGLVLMEPAELHFLLALDLLLNLFFPVLHHWRKAEGGRGGGRGGGGEEGGGEVEEFNFHPTRR